MAERLPIALPRWLVEHAVARPRHPALETRDRILSYAELRARVEILARTLAEQLPAQELDQRACALPGPDEGWRSSFARPIGLLFSTGIAAIEVRLALESCGGIPAPLDPRGTPQEIAHRLGLAGVRCLLVEPGAGTNELLARMPPEITVLTLEEARLHVVRPATAGAGINSAGDGPADHGDGGSRGALADGSDSGSVRTSRVGSGDDPVEARSVYSRDAAEAPALVLFTSGTSGQPSGVLLSRANLVASVDASGLRLGVSDSDRWLVAMPLNHAGGTMAVLRSLITGTTVVLEPRFEVDTVLVWCATQDISLISVVPTMLHRLLEAGFTRESAPKLRCVLLGGARAGRGLLARAGAVGLPVFTTYGLTETASQVATAMPDEASGLAGGVGRPLAGTELAVATESGEVRAAGRGRILVRGPSVARWRFVGSGSLEPLCDAAGWLRTGDLGVLSVDGSLQVLGRLDEVIVTGGENVAPEEIEEVLAAFPGVAEVAAASVADPEWGEVIGVWIVPRMGEQVDVAGFSAFAREHLSSARRPRRITLVDALPRTSSGKIVRAQLRVR